MANSVRELTSYEAMLAGMLTKGIAYLKELPALETLRTGLENLSESFPWIRYRVSDDMKAFETGGRFMAHELQLDGSDDPEAFVNSALNLVAAKPVLPPTVGLLTLYRLCNGDTNSGAVCIVANHSHADGPTVNTLLSILIHSINDPSMPIKKQTEVDVKALIKDIPVGEQQQHIGLTLPANEAAADVLPHFVHHCFKVPFGQLYSLSKQLTVKPQAVLSAIECYCVLSYMQNVPQEYSLVSQISVSTRAHLGLEFSYNASLSSPIFPVVHVDSPMTLKALAQEIQAQIDSKRTTDTMPAFKALSDGCFVFSQPTSTISNIGIGGLELMWICGGLAEVPPQIAKQRSFSFHCITAEDNYCVTFTYLKPGCEDALVSHFVSTFKALINGDISFDTSLPTGANTQ